MRVVLDTNVLVSGFFFGGVPGEILEAWRDGHVQIVVSAEILDEYRAVSEEMRLRHPSRDLGPLIDLLVVHCEVVAAGPLQELVCDDPEDDKFLACALAAQVACIVSGDKHLLRVSGFEGVEVIRPRAFVDRYLAD